MLRRMGWHQGLLLKEGKRRIKEIQVVGDHAGARGTKRVLGIRHRRSRAWRVHLSATVPGAGGHRVCEQVGAGG